MSYLGSCIRRPFSVCILLLLSFFLPINCSYTYQDDASVRREVSLKVAKSPEDMGKLVALEFIKWIQDNPNGVVSLPSGKSAEYFIRYVLYYKDNWGKDAVKEELGEHGIQSKSFPDTQNIKIVQSCEIYPISPDHKRSVNKFISKYYINSLGIKKENTLLLPVGGIGILKAKGLDVVFRNSNISDPQEIYNKEPRSRIEKWQKQAIEDAQRFCNKFEKTLKSWGGIQLYIMPLGYNGDVSLNSIGTSKDSTTRLVSIDNNLNSQLAKEMSSMDFSQKKMGVTIGLNTLLINKNMKVILLINSGTKSDIVKDVLSSKKDSNLPTSVFHGFDTEVYITGLAYEKLQEISGDSVIEECPSNSERTIDKIVINVALSKQKKIMELTKEDFDEVECKEGKFLDKVKVPFSKLKASVVNRTISKIQIDIPDMVAKNILHTGVYHDDISLGYYPIIRQLLRNNQNNFVYFTSGVNSVGDGYIASALSRVDHRWIGKSKHVIFEKRYYELIDDFARSYWAVDKESTELYDTIIVLKHLRKIFNITSVDMLKETIRWLKDDYFPNKSNGEVDSPGIVDLKRMIRQSEADKIGAINNISTDHIHHLNLPFYSSDSTFHSVPTEDFDVEPLTLLLKKKKPDIITILDMPEDYGADAPYKAKIILAAAMRKANVDSQTKLMAYRSHGYRYHIADADKILLVSNRDLNLFVDAFNTCFLTQKKSPFPSPYYEEDTASTVKKAHKELFQELKVLIGIEALSSIGATGESAAISLKINSASDFINSYDKIDVN